MIKKFLGFIEMMFDIPRVLYYAGIDLILLSAMLMAAGYIYEFGEYYNPLVELFGPHIATISIIVTLVLIALNYLSIKYKKLDLDYVTLLRDKIVLTVVFFTWMMASIIITVYPIGIIIVILAGILLFYPILKDIAYHVKELNC